MSSRQHSGSCGYEAIIELHSRLRPAEQGLAGIRRIVLAFGGLLLIGCLVNYLKNDSTNNQEGMIMKTRMKNGFDFIAIATLNLAHNRRQHCGDCGR